MQQITDLHCALTRGDLERFIISTNPDRDTSAAWLSETRKAKTGQIVNFWFYGKRNEWWAYAVQVQTIRAINDGTFQEWFR